MAGEIISEHRATSNRNGGRHHRGFAGDFPRNPQDWHERYWIRNMQTKFVEANGLRFEVLEEGTGDRLALCLHGFPEHAISWRHQIPVLAGMGYRVWAVNQRGYGRTTRPAQVADYALPHFVDDVTALINSASAKNLVLIGLDWGAMVAWSFAAQQHHPLDRLVIMNGPHPL